MAEQPESTEQKTDQKTIGKQSTRTGVRKPQKTTGKASSSSSVAVKAQPALTSVEIARMIDLGLGRGVDSTNPKPWYNKSAFQVRRVTAESVIGTEEGGSLQSYEREITSITSHQINLKASVVVPQAPVEIGVDAEASRSVTSTRRAVGKKVINRSISFRSDFDDAPYKTPLSSQSFDWASSPDPDSSVADTQSEFYTFEERLSQWIIDQILYRQEMNAQEMVAEGRDPGEPKFKLDDDTGSFEPLSVMSDFLQMSNIEERKQIVQDCFDFVANFRITHYVSSIELGAAEYRVFSETEHTKRLGAGGAFGLEQLADVSVSEKSSWKKTKKASNLRRIGKFTSDGHVSRGTLDEAVVGIKVQPISSLVKLPYLSIAMRKALVDYMDRQGDSTSGPFIVACEGEQALYWSVDNTHRTVCATDDIRNASPFFIIPNDEGNNAYEFYIAYEGDDQHLLKKQEVSTSSPPQHFTEQIPRYLSAPLTLCGVNAGSLQLKHHVLEESRLILESRIGKDKEPVNPQNWVNGREVFFVRCARRSFKLDGYICVKQQRRGGEGEWITACVPFKSCVKQQRSDGGEDEWITACVPFKFLHNEQDIFMLFRLLPISYKEQQSQGASASPTENIPRDKSKRNLDQELELLGRGSAPEKFRAPLVKRKSSMLSAFSEGTRRQSKGLAQVQLGTSGGKASETQESMPMLT